MPSNKKTIVLSDVYLPNLANVDAAKDETQKVLQTYFNRFMNEKNYNTMQQTLVKLAEYRYIHNDWIIPNGRYIRYIDVSNAHNLVLKKGGFVTYSNRYYFMIYDKVFGEYKVGKKDRIFFMKLNDDDYNIHKLERMI